MLAAQVRGVIGETYGIEMIAAIGAPAPVRKMAARCAALDGAGRSNACSPGFINPDDWSTRWERYIENFLGMLQLACARTPSEH